jgi:sugar/nucleoside kinase (ribokinase family)
LEKQVIVAGHICLDVIPTFTQLGIQVSLVPGSLHHVGPSLMATGGAVANTGVALHRLGFNTRLIGKVGEDAFGEEILKRLDEVDPDLRVGMAIHDDAVTSYTIVINPPGMDRIFLHCPGANDTFTNQDVSDQQMDDAIFFHFGYPPLMKQMCLNNGHELKILFQRMKDKNIVTSLDMALPDPSSENEAINWDSLLQKTLPFVDFFFPSLEEIVYMVDKEKYKQLKAVGEGNLTEIVDELYLSSLASKLLDYGAAVIVIKLGESGVYIQTTNDMDRLIATNIKSLSHDISHTSWQGKEFLTPCFQVDVKGTTGAGDTTIAGFIGGVMKGFTPNKAATYACAVGAYCVEVVDATSNIPNWNKIEARVARDWGRVKPKIDCRKIEYNKFKDT